MAPWIQNRLHDVRQRSTPPKLIPCYGVCTLQLVTCRNRVALPNLTILCHFEQSSCFNINFGILLRVVLKLHHIHPNHFFRFVFSDFKRWNHCLTASPTPCDSLHCSKYTRGKIKRREPIPLLSMCAWTVVPDRTVLYLSRQHILTRASVPAP